MLCGFTYLVCKIFTNHKSHVLSEGEASIYFLIALNIKSIDFIVPLNTISMCSQVIPENGI